MTIGEWREGEFYFTWYSPRVRNIPADFDMIYDSSRMIDGIFEFLKERDEEVQEKFPMLDDTATIDVGFLSDYLGRDIAMADDVNNPVNFVDSGEFLKISNISPPTKKYLSQTRDVCSRDHNKKVKEIFVIKGSPSRGIITAFWTPEESGKKGRDYYFHPPIFKDDEKMIHEDMIHVHIDLLPPGFNNLETEYERATSYSLLLKNMEISRK